MADEPQSSASRRLVGRLLIGAGAILALLSGACTVLASLASVTSEPGLVLTMLVFGAPPIAIGVLMLVGGRMLLAATREAERRPPP